MKGVLTAHHEKSEISNRDTQEIPYTFLIPPSPMSRILLYGTRGTTYGHVECDIWQDVLVTMRLQVLNVKGQWAPALV